MFADGMVSRVCCLGSKRIPDTSATYDVSNNFPTEPSTNDGSSNCIPHARTDAGS